MAGQQPTISTDTRYAARAVVKLVIVMLGA
jgi:hypothetical protein